MTKAILRGLKTRHQKLGDRPVVLHTTGTGVLIDWSHNMGDHIVDDIYSDLDLDKLDSIPAQNLHRPVDLLFLEADKEGQCPRPPYMRLACFLTTTSAGYTQTVLLCPPTIFGRPEGVLFDKKLANTHSIQIPGLIRSAIERKRVGVVGSGQAIWDHVHVLDCESSAVYGSHAHLTSHPVTDLYMLLTQLLVDSPEKIAHGREGIYFAENGEHLHADLAQHLGQTLFELGAVETPEPLHLVTPEQVQSAKVRLLYLCGRSYPSLTSIPCRRRWLRTGRTRGRVRIARGSSVGRPSMALMPCGTA